MPDPLAYIIVLNWNGLEHLRVCFDSLARLDYPNYRVVMVDNGSGDGSQEFVRENYPGVAILQNRRNIGFARGNNRGMRYALDKGAEYICLLNNDMEVDQSWVMELVAKAETDPAIGACASKMLYYFNRCFINGVGTCMDRRAIGWDWYDGRLDSRGLRIGEECFGFCAGACLLRASALERVGVFDPFYFIYSEDSDLGVRMWKKGYRIVTAPGAVVYHKFSATMKEGSAWKEHLALKNRLYFIAKLYPWREIRAALPEVIGKGLENARLMKWSGRYAEMRALLTAIGRFLLAAPRIGIYRLLHGTTFTERSWAMLEPALSTQATKDVLLRDPSSEMIVPKDRIIMRTDDNGLGEGWYIHEDVKDPTGAIAFSFRWTTRRAVAYLRGARTGPLILEMELANAYRARQKVTLHPSIDGSEIGSCTPDEEWRTFRFAFHAENADIELALVSEPVMPPETTGEPGDLGVQVREISILPDTPVRGEP